MLELKTTLSLLFFAVTTSVAMAKDPGNSTRLGNGTALGKNSLNSILLTIDNYQHNFSAQDFVLLTKLAKKNDERYLITVKKITTEQINVCKTLAQTQINGDSDLRNSMKVIQEFYQKGIDIDKQDSDDFYQRAMSMLPASSLNQMTSMITQADPESTPDPVKLFNLPEQEATQVQQDFFYLCKELNRFDSLDPKGFYEADEIDFAMVNEADEEVNTHYGEPAPVSKVIKRIIKRKW